jgi:hypothetical protein
LGTETLAAVHATPATTPASKPQRWAHIWRPMSRQPSRTLVAGAAPAPLIVGPLLA